MRRNRNKNELAKYTKSVNRISERLTDMRALNRNNNKITALTNSYAPQMGYDTNIISE